PPVDLLHLAVGDDGAEGILQLGQPVHEARSWARAASAKAWAATAMGDSAMPSPRSVMCAESSGETILITTCASVGRVRRRRAICRLTASESVSARMAP